MGIILTTIAGRDWPCALLVWTLMLTDGLDLGPASSLSWRALSCACPWLLSLDLTLTWGLLPWLASLTPDLPHHCRSSSDLEWWLGLVTVTRPALPPCSGLWDHSPVSEVYGFACFFVIVRVPGHLSLTEHPALATPWPCVLGLISGVWVAGAAGCPVWTEVMNHPVPAADSSSWLGKSQDHPAACQNFSQRRT